MSGARAIIAALLPSSADAELFWSELQQIRGTTKEELKRQRARYAHLADLCSAMLEAPAELPLVNPEQLRQQREELMRQVGLIGRHQPRWIFWRHWALMHLAARHRINLGYTSPPRPAPENVYPKPTSLTYRKPVGPGIDYLLAATDLIGTPVQADRALWLLKTYERLNARAVFAGAGGLTVNDDAVFIIKSNIDKKDCLESWEVPLG